LAKPTRVADPAKQQRILAHREKWNLKQAAKQELREEYLAAAAGRTPAQQLQVLDRRLGVGVGAVRERAKLAEKGARRVDCE